jgi:DUF3068 family protein
MKIRFVIFGLVFLALATLQHFWLADFFEQMPVDYVSETRYAAKSRSHQTPSAPVEEYESVIRRRDQTLSSGPDHLIVQGDVHWVTPSGVTMFEILNFYGVDRRTRKNLSGYGNEERFGQFVFPAHTAKEKYDGWNPLYAGPHVASYDHEETVDGLPVYVFNFVVDGIDETAGYSSLPDVPKKYRATTYGKGQIWVEPISGIVVDYDETGVSYFVGPTTGERIGEISQWSDQYTPETRTAQLRLASRERWRMLSLERGIPGLLVAAGLICAVRGLRREKKRRPVRMAKRLAEVAR